MKDKIIGENQDGDLIMVDSVQEQIWQDMLKDDPQGLEKYFDDVNNEGWPEGAYHYLPAENPAQYGILAAIEIAKRYLR